MNNQEQYTAYLFILMDIGHWRVVESLQHLDLILVRLLLWRLPEQLLCGGRRSLLYRVIVRHW